MTFEELKGGSTELNMLTRRSVAELLEELNEVPVESLDEVPTNDIDLQLSTEVAEPVATTSAPTWKDLITISLQLGRDRLGDWGQQFKAHLHQNAAKFGDSFQRPF